MVLLSIACKANKIFFLLRPPIINSFWDNRQPKNLRLAIFQLLLTEKKVLCRNNTQFPIASFLMYIICLSFSLRFHLQDAITLRNLFLCFYGIHDCSPSNIIKSRKFGNIVFNNLHVCIQFLFPPNTFIQHQRPYLDYY